MKAWRWHPRCLRISCYGGNTFIRPHAGRGPAFVELVLEKLQAFSAPAAVWENEILPRRVKGYRHAWLDEVLGQGAWLWRGARDPRDDPRVAFFRRDFDGHTEARRGIGRAFGRRAADLRCSRSTRCQFRDRSGAVGGDRASRARQALGS